MTDEQVKSEVIREILTKAWGARVPDIGAVITDFEIWLIEYLEAFTITPKK